MEPNHTAALEARHTRRLADLCSPKGWLSLVDRGALFEGETP